MSESEAWEAIAAALEPLDEEARRRVLRYAWDRFAGGPVPAEITEEAVR